MSERCTVVVIGAGMAGLAAARHLLREGRVNVTLLEARNRVGGRVLSVYNSQSDSLSPGAGEMGATWFHGTRGNAAYNAATQYALHAPRGAGSTRTPGAKGRKNTYVTIDLERGEIEGRAAQEIGATCRSVSDLVEDASGGDSIYRGFEELGDIDVGPLVRGGALSFPKERAAAQACLLACNIEGCHSLRLLGPPGDYKELRGGNVRLPGGMGRLTSALAQEVEERGGALRLGCAVARIRWDGQRVRITTEDGEELDADAAVCTLPLGVLKERALDSPTALSCVDGVAGVLRPGVAAEAAAAPAAPLFEPTLPQDKQGAIARIGAGNSNKVVLQFAPDAGWQLEHEGYTLLQPTQLARFAPLAGVEDIASMSMTASGAGGSTDTSAAAEGGSPRAAYDALLQAHPWLVGVFGLLRAGPHTADCFLTGECAVHMGEEAEEDVARAMVAFLRLYVPDLPAPSRVLRSRWHADPRSRCAYSYSTMGMQPQDRARLAAPLPTGGPARVAFAGEACSDAHYGTVHGAMETGEAAAATIAAALGAGYASGVVG